MKIQFKRIKMVKCMEYFMRHSKYELTVDGKVDASVHLVWYSYDRKARHMNLLVRNDEGKMKHVPNDGYVDAVKALRLYRQLAANS
jgi:hypothetical protein